jgi:hypothetical protein
MLLVLDETIITETPPLYYRYGHVGEQVRVPITGNRAKRILHGAVNIRSGNICLLITEAWNNENSKIRCSQKCLLLWLSLHIMGPVWGIHESGTAGQERPGARHPPPAVLQAGRPGARGWRYTFPLEPTPPAVANRSTPCSPRTTISRRGSTFRGSLVSFIEASKGGAFAQGS